MYLCNCVAYSLLVLTLLVCINCLSIFILYNSDLYVLFELVMQRVTSPLCSTLLCSILLLVVCSILLLVLWLINLWISRMFDIIDLPPFH
jgi:hypothetical protein